MHNFFIGWKPWRSAACVKHALSQFLFGAIYAIAEARDWLSILILERKILF